MDEDNKIVYSEPNDYFPKEIRKKYKLGEYADEDTLEDCSGIKTFNIVR